MAVNPEMLTLARELSQLTQAELSIRSGINQSVISKYEAGIFLPSSRHIEILADKLDVPVEFFQLRERRYPFGSSCTYHRKQQGATLAQLNQIVAEINLVRIHASLATSGVDIQFDAGIPRLDAEDFGYDICRIAELTRQSMVLPPGPLVNLISAIESAGGIVVQKHLGTRKLDAVSQWPTPNAPPVFIVNSDAPVDRQRFSLAHELGHLVMHRVSTPEMEREADIFASEFLMPKRDILDDLIGLSQRHLHALKLKWRVSMAALVRRARDVNAIDDAKYRHFNISLSRSGYRVREPDVLEPEVPALFASILETYSQQMGYTPQDLCKLLRVTPRQLYAEYGIGSPPSLRFA